ncbi:MAG: hypothetical protein AVDCRST_MAG78-842, partial [uncultured Rubrobacteraceae bacterium]
LSETSRLPPTITASVPSRAFITPPLTGASSISIPASASLPEIVRVEEGFELDVSIKTLPGDRLSCSPSSPRTICSTTAELGRDKSTTSAAEARVLGLFAGSAAVSSSWAIASRSTSKTKTS